ncbi:MAG: PA2778 family cysteine peptidase [Pseudobdellovibrio sp.]
MSGLSGCITPARQTYALLHQPTKLPPYIQIDEVPFIDQTNGYCGPATLSMAMNWAGEKVTINEIAAEVYTPGMKGSFQTDMISAGRRHGLMAVPIHNLNDLLTEVAAGHPVIVFENLSLSWLPQWHYAVVFGYDIPKAQIIMHSGHDAFYHWSLEKFERSWMLGDYWGLVVLPAGELAVTADEKSNLAAAVGLEQLKKFEQAEKSYRQILKKWPNSLVSMIGLANIAYVQGRRSEAVRLLTQAVKQHPESAEARHNLTVAESIE